MPYHYHIYTADFYCPHCERAKSLLRRLGIPFEETIGTLPTGLHSYPQIYFGPTYIGGCDQLFKLYRAGELE
jgi:glutaredoxin 3